MLRISGHSDDVVCLEGIVSDEIGDRMVVIVGNPDAQEGQDAYGIKVKMRYVNGGVWAATVEPIGEDVKCPWDVKVEVHKYTSIVTIDCPEGTPVKWRRARVRRRG